MFNVFMFLIYLKSGVNPVRCETCKMAREESPKA